MIWLWLALVGFGASVFYFITEWWAARCFVRGCPRAAIVDCLWCDHHQTTILEESRRVDQTIVSSSAPPMGGDARITVRPRLREVPPPRGSGYSSPAGLRLTHRCIDCREPANYRRCPVTGSEHRYLTRGQAIQPGTILHLAPPYNHEEHDDRPI